MCFYVVYICIHIYRLNNITKLFFLIIRKKREYIYLEIFVLQYPRYIMLIINIYFLLFYFSCIALSLSSLFILTHTHCFLLLNKNKKDFNSIIIIIILVVIMIVLVLIIITSYFKFLLCQYLIIIIMMVMMLFIDLFVQPKRKSCGCRMSCSN